MSKSYLYLYPGHIATIDNLRSPDVSQSRALAHRERERSLVTRQMSDKEMVTMAADTRSLDTNFMSVTCATNL